MAQTRIIALIVLLVIASGAAYWLLQPQQPVSTSKQWVFDGLAEQAQQLTRIRLENSTGVLFEAVREQAQWSATHVQAVARYPVNEQRLAGFVTDVVNAKQLERKTSKAENYARLGLRNVTDKDSEGVLLTLEGTAGQWQLVIGNRASSGQGMYIRKPDEQQAWLMDKSPELPMDEFDWLRQPILSIDEDTIDRVQAEGEGGWTLIRDDENNWVLSEQPEDRALRYDGVLDSTVSNVLNLRFEGIEAVSEGDMAEQQIRRTLRISGESLGEYVIHLTGSEESPTLWIASAPSGDNTQPWNEVLFRISSFSAGQLDKHIDSLLSEPAQAEALATPPLDEGESPQ